MGGDVGKGAFRLVLQGSCPSGLGHSGDKELTVRNSKEGVGTACPEFSVQSSGQGALGRKERRTEKEIYRQFQRSF